MTQNSAAARADGDGPSDADLIERSRAGDSEAFAELWRRHYVSGVSVARSITSTFDADDLVQEAFSRIFQSVRRGGGPTGSFRAYLFTSIRNTAADWGRARADTTLDDVEEVADPDAGSHVTDEALDRSLTHKAFASLPPRWQEVLWYTEIEGRRPAEVAPLLGMKPAAVAQLAFRAREGLREAWIQAHLQSVEDDAECQWSIEHLGAYTRGNLSQRDTRRIETHLSGCPRCPLIASEAKEVSRRLALVLLPVIVGSGAAVAALATLREGAVSAVASAMPASVTGAAPASAAASASAGASATGAGASATIGGTAAGASAAGGAFGSIGATVALLAAGVAVVAGVSLTLTQSTPAPAHGGGDFVETAEVLRDASSSPSPSGDEPQLTTPSGSLTVDPEHSDRPSSNAPIFPSPQDAAPPTPTLEPTPDPTTTPAPDEDPTPTPTPSPTPEPTPTPTPTPTPDPTPTPTPTPDPTPTPTPTPDPTPTPTPTPDPTPTPTPDPTPTLPEGSPEIASVETVFVDVIRTEVRVAVAGEPGATVQAVMHDTVQATTTLDESGAGQLLLHPSLEEILRNEWVGLRYVAGTQVGEPANTRVRDLIDWL